MELRYMCIGRADAVLETAEARTMHSSIYIRRRRMEMELRYMCMERADAVLE